MSLDISLVTPIGGVEKFEWSGLTHNLIPMAKAAGFYATVWRPEETYDAPVFANELIADVEEGLRILKGSPSTFKRYNPDNGWGTYEGLVDFMEKYLEALRENRTCYVKAWR